MPKPLYLTVVFVIALLSSTSCKHGGQDTTGEQKPTSQPEQSARDTPDATSEPSMFENLRQEARKLSQDMDQGIQNFRKKLAEDGRKLGDKTEKSLGELRARLNKIGQEIETLDQKLQRAGEDADQRLEEDLQELRNDWEELEEKIEQRLKQKEDAKDAD